ncbi:carbon starvation CstA family protein [Candidatus Margulisiibacteriota bacterium]
MACGAISGFHCLISSGTTAKQCASEKDALFLGYGSMLLEGSLSILAIVAVKIAMTIMGVFLVSFAATTLDSAARVQRYVVTELAKAHNFKLLSGKHAAALFAIGTAMWLAFSNGDGKGAMALWPLFGAINQLLAGLALLVITIYLARKRISTWAAFIPMVFMVIMTTWALTYNLTTFCNQQNWLLLIIGSIIFVLELWMIAEGAVTLYKHYFIKPLPAAVFEEQSTVKNEPSLDIEGV